MMRFYATGALCIVLSMSGLSTVAAQDAVGLEQSSLLTRPLFEPSRRGFAVQQAHDDLPVVTGVVGDPAGWTAIFAGTPHVLGGLSVRAGGMFQGWHVVAVSPHEVHLERAGEEHRLVPKSEYAAGHPQVKIEE